MRRRHQYHAYYGTLQYRRPRRYHYEPGPRRSTVPFRGAMIVLLALATLVVLASLIWNLADSGAPCPHQGHQDSFRKAK